MKKKKRIKHHIKNRCNGGKSTKENLLLIDQVKERKLHEIFGNRDFYEIIVLLIRVCRAKHYERINPKIEEFYKKIKAP
jgi:hypothetical protein